MWLKELVGVLTAATLSVGAIAMHAQDTDSELDRFGAGRRVGDSLMKGCVAFTGVVQSIGGLESEPGETDPQRAVMSRKVELKVSEWLYGRGTGETVQLVYFARPEISKTSLGPWVPWENVKLEVGATLLVIRWAKDAPRPSWLGKPDDVAFVVSDKELFAPIREAIAQHRRFERDRDEVAKVPQWMGDKQDNLMKGYLLTYLMDGEPVHNVDRAGTLLGGLIGNKSLPEPGRVAVAEWLASTYYRLSETTRKGVTESLVVSAAGDDAKQAVPALTALMKLGDQQMLNLKSLLTQDRQRKIVANYRTFRAQNQAELPHPELESQIGIR